MTRTHAPRRIATVAAAAAVAATGLVTFSSGANAAVGLTGTATPALGIATGSTVVSIAGTGLLDANGALAVGQPKVVLGAAGAATNPTCTSAALAANTALTVSTAVASAVVSATRAILTLPSASSAMPSSGAALKASVCFPVLATVNATTPTFVSVPYTYAQPVAFPTSGAKFAPTAGPVSGGQTVTLYAKPVSGSNGLFQPTTTVLFGGTLGLTPKVATDGLSLTVITPQVSAGGAVDVTIRTPGFPDVKDLVSAGAGHGYTYSRSIIVTPAVGTTTAATPITIKGSGFLGSTYSTPVTAATHTVTVTTTNSSSAVVATAGTFSSADLGAAAAIGATSLGTITAIADSTHATVSTAVGSSAGAAGESLVLTPVARGGASVNVYLMSDALSAAYQPAPTACADLQIVSDTELTCVVPTGSAAALRVVVTDAAWGSKVDSNDTVVSRGAIFTRADF